MKKEFLPTIITVLIAVFGYVATYANDVRIMNRKEKLERVNKQLRELYGPLYGLTSANGEVWSRFMQDFSPNQPITKTIEGNEEKKKIWRNWMITVFLPINKEMYDKIINNTDLIIEDEFPKPLKDFCAHEETYRPVVKNWEAGNYSRETALLDYPNSLDAYAKESYGKLKKIQFELLNSSK